MRMRCNTTLLKARGKKIYHKQKPRFSGALCLRDLFNVYDLVLLRTLWGIEREELSLLLLHESGAKW